MKQQMGFFYRRRVKKQVRLLIRHARHVRNLREDVAGSEELRRLDEWKRKAGEAIGSGSCEAMESAAKSLEKSILAVIPRRSFQPVRDNIEMFVVAIAVAMAFRTYFLQPFKIPTSSMSPTLIGITYEPRDAPAILDRIPFSLARWAVSGQWYSDVRAATSGVAGFHQGSQGELVIIIGGVRHAVHDGMRLHVEHGQRVIAGQTLAAGIRTAGDHILVNKVAWHFRRPERGEIMVFRTDGIHHPQIKQNEYYVKRLVGMPGERINIVEPYIEINGSRLSEPAIIARIQQGTDGYVGYRKAETPLEEMPQGIRLGADDFYACGDNQKSSLDSRYWGSVPRKNLVGPAFFVYWPFSRRWGTVR